MQYPQRFSNLPEYAFPRLRALLDPLTPGGDPLPMSIGEPMHPLPPMLGEELARHAAGYAKYPPNDGAPALRESISAWVARRYGVTPDPQTEVLPLNGTREGLFSACIALIAERKNGERPVVLLPNPFYQCYAVAALTAGAEPVYVPALTENGFLPDFAAVPADLLARTAAVYMCSPANPQGAVADAAYWTQLLALAEQHDFRILADECYAEIYRDTPPVGALETVHAIGADPERVMIFHSLSKRSNLPGLRSGFCVGGPRSIAAMKQLRSYAGAPLPLPAQMAAAAVWADEEHVIANRALYAEKFALADDILGNMPGYTSPQAGFFLWVAVNDDEDMTKRLWSEDGVKVLPGSYLSRDTDPRLGGGNPGAGYIRVALVAPAAEVSRGLHAIRAQVEKERESGA
ncbi:Aspartate/methionine/tyrosine aminotransferase [Monaibacterium marinum]|uniref:Aspartate/methionine/tyrosine aminotransferase n=1 Tax=Pontivivens marinum TaxID=1690039 RepID=A0A2C9CN09_9RHOB|nr:aminotransferase class I/II-fold pyridoxal phosphate-dependent enzyme [Monaibacterium marinum]SOH92585.1 Aspartate/methionine/tyrosine aminotransferase [Monaibacterium marinum]